MNTARAIDWVVVTSTSPLVTVGVADVYGNIRYQEIKSLPAVVGRSELAEIHVHDPFASRMQCAIAYTGDELVVRDLESTHGTSVNGDLIDVCRLRDGDEIACGKLTKITVEQIAGKREFAESECP